jgi:hypothetical protein
MKTENLITLGVAGAAIYLLYKSFGIGKSAVNALNDTGSAIGSGLYDIFNPSQDINSTFWIVTFPNGANHAINAMNVRSDGTFTYDDGRNYQIVTANGKKYARAY